MKRLAVLLALTAALSLSLAGAQEIGPLQEPEPAPPPESAATAPATLPPATGALSPASPAAKADALLLYNQGRNLDTAGKKTEAAVKYREAITVCDRELASDPTRMDAYTVKCWSLFRLDRFKEVVSTGTAALKVKFDARIVEVMGESYFHLNDDASALKFLQRYIENAGEYADRVATAYFYMGEAYLRAKRYDHADIAYSIATYREGNIARWWFRYGSAVEALGEYARAADLYARALRLNPGMTEAIEAQARVKARI